MTPKPISDNGGRDCLRGMEGRSTTMHRGNIRDDGVSDNGETWQLVTT